MTAVWPDIDSSHREGESFRHMLDYLAWIAREMRQLGYHSGSERDFWCNRVQNAYAALFLPMLPGHGDPYPPDVPPARNPGIWPDVPSASIPGMTLRHQLTVIGILVEQLRSRVWPHIRPHEVQEWDRRISAARGALDHGPDLAMPEEATSQASEEALEAARAHDKALQDKARQRAKELRRQLKATAARKKAAKKKTAKKAPAKKKAVKKKTAKKKAPAKKAKKKAVKKKAAKKKASAKKKSAKRR